MILNDYPPGSIVQSSSLLSMYGDYAIEVLSRTSNKFIKLSAPYRNRYQVVKDLPGLEEYSELLTAVFTTDVEDLLSHLKDTLIAITEEFEEWNKRQYSRSYNKDVESTLNHLHALDPPSVRQLTPAMLRARVSFIPTTSKSIVARLDDTVGILLAITAKLGPRHGRSPQFIQFVNDIEQYARAVVATEEALPALIRKK